MFLRIDLNPEETARLYALQVSKENCDAQGNPYFRVTKSGSRQGNRDKVEISIAEFMVGDRKSVENRLAVDTDQDENLVSREGAHKGDPIPAALLQKIFNAIGRFPGTETAVAANPSAPAGHIPLRDLLKIVLTINDQRDKELKIRFMDGLCAILDTALCGHPWHRDEILAEFLPKVNPRYWDTSSTPYKDAAKITDILYDLLNQMTKAEPKPGVIPLDPITFGLIYTTMKSCGEVFPFSFTGWMDGVLAAHARGDKDSVRKLIIEADDKVVSRAASPAALQDLLAYLRKHCLGEADPE
ncbi:MAG: hypothetical protein PHW53_03415 [Patescibacteria group bacterium]|nr:hypothetical protein [Patescibacteria group bacterium]